ncbi:MAG: DUF2029 domain-containing protein [Actinobacteria bacterium]|nr:DUF2029 domain-containing protein [Actinomycetota bacterium]
MTRAASSERSFRPAELPAAALGALAALLFLAAWWGLHHGFYARDTIVDTPVYRSYGDRIAAGEVPYRDFRLEYPPGALPVFALPALGADTSFDRYRRRFEGLMAGSGVALLGLTAATLALLRAARRRMVAALAFAALAPLALGSVMLSRFDLWPAALTAAALAAIVAGRDRLGSATLALAVAAKLYPGVLVPLAAVWVWRRRGRREAFVCGGIFLAVLAACYLPFLALGPFGVAESLGRQLSRPLQLESLGAAVLLALHHLGALQISMESSHGSQNVAGLPGVVVGIVQTAVQAGVLVAVWVAFARGRMEPERLVTYAAATVLAFVALGKVLSPQFLIWLVPLVPLVRGRRGLAASALLGASLVLTQLWFPFRYWDFALRFDETASWLVLARDVVLVAALAVLLLPARAPAWRRAP